MLGTIAIPRGHFECPYPFVESLVKFLLTKPDVEVMFKEGALVDDNRNSLSRMFKGDWLIFLDTDMTFFPEDIYHLINYKEDIVGALYFKGQPPHEPLAYRNDKPIDNYISGSAFEVDKMALGFTKINRRVIEAVGENPFQRIGTHGEDASFCIRVKEKGFKVICDTSIRPKHIRYRYIGENDRIIM